MTKGLTDASLYRQISKIDDYPQKKKIDRWQYHKSKPTPTDAAVAQREMKQLAKNAGMLPENVIQHGPATYVSHITDISAALQNMQG